MVAANRRQTTPSFCSTELSYLVRARAGVTKIVCTKMASYLTAQATGSPMTALPEFCSADALGFPLTVCDVTSHPGVFAPSDCSFLEILGEEETFSVCLPDVDGIWICPKPFCLSLYTRLPRVSYSSTRGGMRKPAVSSQRADVSSQPQALQ